LQADSKTHFLRATGRRLGAAPFLGREGRYELIARRSSAIVIAVIAAAIAAPVAAIAAAIAAALMRSGVTAAARI